MSEISVEYVDHMGDDLRVANVARVSFNNWKKELEEKDVRLIDYLASHEHTSPFRHCFLSVRCTAPIFLARQLAKHQVGLSWNEVSRRYVDSEPEFFDPDEWRTRPEGSIKQGSSSDTVEDIVMKNEVESWPTKTGNAYQLAVEGCVSCYNSMIEAGVSPEMARMVLPQSMMTQWIWSGSLQAFFNTWRLRIDAHAQKEAQVFASKLGDVINELFPVSWKALGESQ